MSGRWMQDCNPDGDEVRPTVVINSEPEATVKEFAISGACKG